MKARAGEPAGLIAAARSGDADAFGTLYRRYLGDVRSFCARRIADPVQAEDLAQETFVRAFERVVTFDPSRPFWPWLSTIARNLCVDEVRLRRTGLERVTPDPPEPRDLAPDPVSEDVAARDGRHRLGGAIAAAMSTLDPRDRAFLWQRAVEERPYHDIAAAHRTTEAAARTATWRARAALRALLADVREEMRTFVLSPVLWVTDRARRAWLRARLALADGHELLVQRGGITIVGVVVVSAGWTVEWDAGRAPGTPPVPLPPRGVIETSERALVQEPARAGARHATTGDAGAPGSPLAIGVGAEQRDGGAGPRSAGLRVEIRDPEGRVLYWEQVDIQCEDDRPLGPGLEAGPVRTYC